MTKGPKMRAPAPSPAQIQIANRFRRACDLQKKGQVEAARKEYHALLLVAPTSPRHGFNSVGFM
jgi:hypothetical protein